MEKVRPWCGQPSDRGRLKNRTEHTTTSVRTAWVDSIKTWTCCLMHFVFLANTLLKDEESTYMYFLRLLAVCWLSLSMIFFLIFEKYLVNIWQSYKQARGCLVRLRFVLRIFGARDNHVLPCNFAKYSSNIFQILKKIH